MLKNKITIVLVASFLLLATAPGVQAQKSTDTMTERYLAPVENSTCGALNGDFEYGCRMIFWGFYVVDYQLVCDQLGIYDLDGCDFPEEPPRAI
jgi:hypothetical protein